jgi:murein DD-endopeptidase MepM/ murein hydrolase activator NlpD
MGASRSVVWPQVVAIALMGMGVAGCADSSRFSDFSSDRPSRGEVTGSIPPGANQGTSRVESQTLPHLSSNGGEGISGGGRGMGSYQPGNDVTGSLPPAPPPPTFTWEGGTPVVVARGETLETISHRYGVPVSAILEANSITNPATVHPGQHLVIPRRRGPATALSAPPTRVATTAPAIPSTAPVGPPRTALTPAATVHVVAPGQTLHSIARLYGKSVMVIAKANNIAPDAMVKVGERITIPGGGSPVAAAAPAPTVAPPAAPRGSGSVGPVATVDSPHSARLAAPVAPEGEDKEAKGAEAAGAFRWPVRGRVIAGFGPKPNGLQNDGINLAVPEGTPVKAADDGVVAYAGNELKGYGNLVLVRHSNGFVTAYAHASEIMVKRGDTVKRGQVIAKSGQTGSVTSPQLHFEIRKGSTPVDPAQYLNGA